MGSSHSKFRKPRRHLPKVTANYDATEEPSAWTPMGAVGAYGKIARALDDPDPKRRRAARIIGALTALPACVVLIAVIVGLLHG